MNVSFCTILCIANIILSRIRGVLYVILGWNFRRFGVILKGVLVEFSVVIFNRKTDIFKYTYSVLFVLLFE